jgi:hypothetical protein
MDYQTFLESKRISMPPSGFDISKDQLNPLMFEFQKDITKWNLAKGKSADFAGTGLGKTPIQTEFGRQIALVGGDTLILAPLAVSLQTVREAAKFGISANLCESQNDVQPGINITNYERLHRFDTKKFAAAVLDESSILKAYSGKTRTSIIEAFRYTPYKLACTATPAPNDYMELGNHAEFLGVMTRAEMLSTFFVHDGGDTSKWRLKGHAIKSFWEWVSSWAVMLTKPSDLGYSNDGFDLPPLRLHQITVDVPCSAESLLPIDARTLQERLRARRDSLEDRVKACADIVNNWPEASWLIWCNLNDESGSLTRAINQAVEIRGSDKPEDKEERMIGFSRGTIKKLVTKPSIAGFGMNWQHCSKMAFVGLSDSFEEYYQAVRRCWRFGQQYPVDVYVITAETEGAVVANIQRKECDFETMLSGMISATQEITRKNIRGTERQTDDYNAQKDMMLPGWVGVA